MVKPDHPTKAPWVAAPILAALLGILVGLSAFTFYYAEGGSYLSDDPRACVNCHVMRAQFDAWHRSSHTTVAACNDCHAPNNFVGKWVAKGVNGFLHSWAFTTGSFPDPIRIRGFNVRIAQDNCVACHQALVSQIHAADEGRERRCVSCHGNVGHAT